MQDRKWNWKDSPEWATHVGIVPFESSEYLIWYNDLRYKYVEFVDTPYPWAYGCLDKTKVVVVATRQSEQENLWDGEGIPPNGTICMARAVGVNLHKVKVICQPVDEDQADKVVAVVGLEGERKFLLWWTNDYQKIKTKEEVEAEKEEKCQVDLIYRHLVQQTELSDTPLEALLTTAKNLYEDGLRFIDKTN